MSINCISIFLVLLSWSCYGSSISFKWKNISPEYGYRSLQTGRWLHNWNGIWFRSIERKITNASITKDVVWGSISSGPGHNDYPLAWLGYFSSNVSRNGPDMNDFDVKTAAGFIGSTFLKFVENDVNGELVKKLYFKRFDFSFNADLSGNLTNVTAGIYAFVMDGTTNDANYENLKVQLQYIITEEAGEIDFLGGIKIVPKAIESIIVIENWPYDVPNNTLSLFTAAVTREGSWASDNQFYAGTGADKVFFHVASNALIDGTLKNVVLKSREIIKNIKDEISTVLWALVIKRYPDAVAQVVEIEFPAGASRIEYDPTTGSGDSPYDTSVDEMTKRIIIIVSIIVGSIALVMIIAASIYFWKSKKNSGYRKFKD